MKNIEINIFGRQEIISRKELDRIYKIVLNNLKKKAKINLIFASEQKIKELNKKFRKIDSATDVLSFPYDDDDCTGEIIISTSKVRKQAREDNTEPKKELYKIFIHGLLHLFSYDHISEKDKIIMEKKEEELLKII